MPRKTKPLPQFTITWVDHEKNPEARVLSRGISLAENPLRLPILGRVGADFLLRVRGDSMEGGGIMEGDLVQVRRQPSADEGDIVVAMVGEEGVVKRLRRRGRGYVLESANPKYPPIAVQFQVIGKVLGLVRRYA